MRPPLLTCALMLTGLSACASLTGPTPAPSCDGGARRPLNRSLWDWEAARPVPVPSAPVAAPPTEVGVSAPVSRPDPIVRKGEAGPDRPAASARGRLPVFDLAASFQPCEREPRHG